MQLRFRDIESNISPLRFFSELLGIHSYCYVNYEISIDHYRPPLGRTDFDSSLKTSKSFTPEIPMKYSKNGQTFTMPENT